MNLGQQVRVRGELSTSHGERRLKAGDITDIAALTETSSINARPTTVEELSEDQVGTLISLNGQIQSLSDNELAIQQNEATLVVYLKSNPLIDANQFERGDSLSVTGVLTSYDSEQRLRPRANTDIVVTQHAADVLASATAQSGKAQSQNLQTQLGILLFTISAAALGAFALIHSRKRRVALAAS